MSVNYALYDTNCQQTSTNSHIHTINLTPTSYNVYRQIVYKVKQLKSKTT